MAKPRKPGRPKGRAPQGKPIYIRVTPEERAHLEGEARRLGYKDVNWLVRRCLGLR